MGTTPDQLKAEIEATRGRLTSDVDALTDKVSPSAAMHRSTSRAKGRMLAVKDAVIGTAQSTGDSMSSTWQGTGDAIGERAGSARTGTVRAARGNPLAAGLIAFGAGLLVSSLLPSTEAERQAAGTLQERAKPMLDELSDRAKDEARSLKDDLQPVAQDAAASVKATAQEAASDVQDTARGEAAGMQDHARDSADTLRSRSS